MSAGGRTSEDGVTRLLQSRAVGRGAWLLVVAACSSAGAEPRDVAVSDRVALNRACVQCHPTVAAAWETSLHRQSWSEPDFAFAVAREPKPFCRGCHAPEADPQHEPTGELAAIGVACVTCHVPRGESLAADAVLTGPTVRGSGNSPHAVVRRESFGSAQQCASCHEFSFPGQPHLELQTTLSEHAASPDADVPCQGCHMPAGDHGFAVTRDPDALRDALSVIATRPEPTRVHLQLASVGVGHAFPTGDPFRRLVVEVEADGELLDAVTLERTIEEQHLHGLYPRRVVTQDNRLGTPDAESSISFAVPDGADVTWRVAYERVDQTVGEYDPVVFGRTHLAAGTLPARRAR